MKRKLGHLDQAAFVRPITYTDGRANGLEALQFYNGVIDFTVLKSKCLDIGDMRYKGTNIAFLAKSGLMAPQDFDLDMGLDQQSGLACGFMFTCGLSNAGARCEDNGVLYPFHGQIRSTPAEGCSFGVEEEADGIRLFAKGTMREAVLQSRHLSIKRKVETAYLRPGFTIMDEITNEGYVDEPVHLIYHTNFGWPMLDEGTRVIIPSNTRGLTPVDAPEPVFEETVTVHDAVTDENGFVTCRVENEKLGIGAAITYKKEELPALGEWRCLACGDYVIGIEPGLCGVDGRAELLKTGRARVLHPGEKITTRVDFTFYDL